MSFLPAGMLTSAKPQQRPRPSLTQGNTQNEVKMRRPIVEAMKQCNRLQPSQYIFIFNKILIVEIFLIFIKVFAGFISKSKCEFGQRATFK